MRTGKESAADMVIIATNAIKNSSSVAAAAVEITGMTVIMTGAAANSKRKDSDQYRIPKGYPGKQDSLINLMAI